MGRVFKLPDLGEGIHEGEIVSVLVEPGDEIREGQSILVVETDKATVEIPSPFTGVVESVHVEAGQVVHVGESLITFRSETVEAEKPREPEKEKPPEAEPEKPAEPEMAAPEAAAPRPAAAGPVPASPSTRRLARELGVDLRTVSGSGPGGRVTAEDVRRAAERPEAPEAAPREAPAPPREAPPVSTVRPTEVGAPELPDFGRFGPVERVPLRSVRRAIAKQMALAWSQIPHVSHHDAADITELERLRRHHAPESAESGTRLTLTPFLLKAAVAALKRFPFFNASLDAGTEEIIVKRYYHLGVATDTPRGLVVPVVRDVDRKSVTELAKELQELSDLAREGNLKPEHVQGGTFTLTNIGPLGGRGFSPIINYPQTAILGAGQARLEPVVRGTLEEHTLDVRLMLPMVLAFDHRIVDGADAARFMNTVRDLLQDTQRLLLNL